MQGDLHLSPQDWGYITGAFAIAYALFEIPSGFLGDRFGARAMLTRIVLWWSAFTALTGLTSSLWSLITVRFLFGAGEAGAYPTASTSVFRWFPEAERGRAFGVIFFSSQLGGVLAPLLIVPIQTHFGWRTSFYIFGAFGIAWAGGWWRLYRNRPMEKAGISDREIAEIGSPPEDVPRRFPWQVILANRNVRVIMLSTFSYLYAYYFFLFWLPTYMMQARGFTEAETKLSALPFVLGALSNIAGGFARDAALRRFGPKWGPRLVGIGGLVVAAGSAVAAYAAVDRYVALSWLGLCYAGITLQQPTVWATCVDIGKRYAGAVAGCMNTAGAMGGLVSSLICGYWVQRTGNYDVVLLSMAGALVLGAGLWLRIDASETLEQPGARQ
jgi:MFS transporter, ACS family, glucarate transporter